MSEGLSGFVTGFALAAVVGFFAGGLWSKYQTAKLCQQAANELGRECIYDDGACMCATDEGRIVELGS